ncbi:Exosomal 3'-5' exoribonuclease complex, subunit Rrp42 [Phaffia rhodozyma]|uniref:Ribosomal RNA-processing protein 42 n=1 Tax=Phaffia rhodozyma TaxID=264483 RepID=A0A0F7SUL4_PHARH|nr:Exosomal 3'-5' exoribonuclease complex, subunit Rrp42 [Phaffia rhodozyma]
MAPTTVLSQSESSFITSSLVLPTPIRTDGRGLHEFRPFELSTGVAPQANGSARVQLGHPGSTNGTEAVTAVRLEVLDRPVGFGKDEGSSVGSRVDVTCSVDCSPSAFPLMDSKALDAYSTYLTTLVQQTIPPLLPPLPITSSLSFHYTIDTLLTSTAAGNIPDVVFLSIRSALSDLRVPRTRNVAYQASLSIDENGESDMVGIKGAALGGGKKKGAADRKKGQALAKGAEFEIEDYWDEGERLDESVRLDLPVCITLNILPNSTHFLDATTAESLASPTHLLTFINGKSEVVGLRLVGSTEVGVADLKALLTAAKTYASNLITASNASLDVPAVRVPGGLGYFGS